VRRQPKYRVHFLASEEDAVPSTTEITVSQLSRLIGLPHSPAIIDVRADEDFASDPRLIPGSQRRAFCTSAPWARDYDGQSVVLICKEGLHLSQGAGAWMRQQGVDAQTLEGGYEAWRKSGQLLVRADGLPQRDEAGRTIWVTRARPKVVRIACPWLIRRFIDPKAVFLFVTPSEVAAVASRFKATPFDVPDAFWGDRGEKCTFDVMVEELGLDSDALARLALIVRGADTGRLELTPQSGGLLAASLGFSRMYRDDLAQLEAAMALYDALYRWCRDASNESHA
jgi:rhodanese-related sulfurtransferase